VIAAAGGRPIPARVETEDDGALVAAALRDRAQFWLLYERHLDRLHWYAFTQLGSTADADDVVAETMLAAYERLEQFDAARGSFATWLFAIARRKVADHGRAHRRLWRLVVRQQAYLTPFADDDPSGQIVRDEQAALVYAAVRRLSRAEREVLALRHSAGLSTPEIATLLGDSPAAVRKRLSRAHARLRALLTDGAGDT
jgi:RNA polymerase sigma factor (sigma-70 family)